MRRAFTLIELLIVVAIIAILAAIAVPNFLEAQVRAKVSRAKSDMRTFATALETYTVDHNKPMSARNSEYNAYNGPSLVNAAHTGTGWVSYRFRRLTTPISYLSSVLVDVFAKDGRTLTMVVGGTGGDFSGNYDTFDYWNGYDLAPGGPGGGTSTASFRGAGVTSGAAWRIVSAGPDKIQAFGGAQVAAGAEKNAYGVDYDPTNGTVSNGDIVRIASAPGPISPDPQMFPSIDRILNKYNGL